MVTTQKRIQVVSEVRLSQLSLTTCLFVIMYQTVGRYEGKMEIGTKGEKTKARVLEAAMQMVNEKGFCSTSINDIIQATGVKKGNLYFHFPSKEELSLAILEEASREFAAFLSRSLHGELPLARLANFLDAVLEKHGRARFVGG